MSIAEDIIGRFVINFVACTLKKNTVTLLFAKAATTNYQKKKKDY